MNIQAGPNIGCGTALPCKTTLWLEYERDPHSQVMPSSPTAVKGLSYATRWRVHSSPCQGRWLLLQPQLVFHLPWIFRASALGVCSALWDWEREEASGHSCLPACLPAAADTIFRLPAPLGGEALQPPPSPCGMRRRLCKGEGGGREGGSQGFWPQRQPSCLQFPAPKLDFLLFLGVFLWGVLFHWLCLEEQWDRQRLSRFSFWEAASPVLPLVFLQHPPLARSLPFGPQRGLLSPKHA